ncbi:MAG: squalene synthase HpnC [Actinomycetota bacterium]|nr:squalene synthase HpnC [Actinomycetota bacterium]
MDDVQSAEDGAIAVLARVAAGSAGQMGAENFPVALRLLPRDVRADLARVYAFARFVDDVGDEAPGDRASLLNVVESDVRELWGGEPALEVVAALKPVVLQHGIGVETLLGLVEANRVDQQKARYQSFADLLEYCRLSAAPIGRMVLCIAGAATASNLADSDQVCAALQVLEHCQDVAEDARAGRVYLPADDLRAAGVADVDLTASHTSSPLRSAVALQVDRARELLRAGVPLVRRLHGWSRIAVAGYVAGGLATADALAAAHYDVLADQVRPTHARTARHALRLLLGSGSRCIR